MTKKINHYLAGAALLAVCGSASAVDCGTIVQLYTSAVSVGNTSQAATYLSNHSECFGGTATTSTIQITGTTVQQVSTISNILSSRILPSSPNQQASAGAKSMAAGGKGANWNTWASLNTNGTRQAYQSTTASGITNATDILSTIVGADFALSPTMAMGVSAAFDSGSGSATTTGTVGATNLKSSGYTIAPYMGLQINQALALDASIGFGKGEIGMTGNVTAEADRLFAAANLSYAQWMGKIQLTGKAGYLHAEENYGNSKVSGTSNANTSSKNTVDQMRLGVQAGYWMNSYMPYAGLAYASDLQRSTTQFGATIDPIGKDAFVLTLGVNFFSLTNGLTGGIAYSEESGRTNQKTSNLMANLNLRF